MRDELKGERLATATSKFRRVTRRRRQRRHQYDGGASVYAFALASAATYRVSPPACQRRFAKHSLDVAVSHFRRRSAGVAKYITDCRDSRRSLSIG